MRSGVPANEPFAVLLGDDIIQHEVPVLKQMIDVYHETGGSVVAVQPVDWADVSRYDIVKPRTFSERVHTIEEIVEKPKRKEAPSNLAVGGRYVLTP